MSKIFSYIKDNWKLIFFIIFTIFISSLLFNNCKKNTTYENLFQKYKENIEEHQKEIKQLQTIQNNERKKREEQYQQFIEEMRRIEQTYSNKLNEITKQSLVSKNRIIKLAKEDPNTLTIKIKETFGIPIVSN